MAYETNETIKRLWQKFLREQLDAMHPEERQKFEQQFAERLDELLQKGAGDGRDGFLDLVGFGEKGAPPFGDIPFPYIKPDFDEAVIPSQLHAAAELYYVYQHERMKVFQVTDVLRRLFEQGRIRIQRGPGARGLYLLEKWKPLRYSLRDRMISYRRVFNYGTSPAPAGAIVNKNLHRQLVAFMASVAQYFRDLLIGEVIRGGQLIEQRPFGSVATIQRLGLDLRWALDRASYGNILALTMETGHYLRTMLQLLDAADIKKAFDANTKWDVVEIVSNRYLGGVSQVSFGPINTTFAIMQQGQSKAYTVTSDFFPDIMIVGLVVYGGGNMRAYVSKTDTSGELIGVMQIGAYSSVPDEESQK